MVLLESLNLEMGSKAPDFRLPATDEKMYSLKDFSQYRVLVVIFMCNHCPYVQAIWERLVKLKARYNGRGVEFVGINPNLNPKYPEESFEKMKEYFERYKMNFPYLQDATQEVAREYKAQCTPDIYVYNEARELVYHGRLDDNWKDSTAVTKSDLDEAIDVVLSEKTIEGKQVPSMGCSIKWRD